MILPALSLLSSLVIPAVAAASLPPPTGRYQVGIAQHVLPHANPNDPVAPDHQGKSILLTFYYPTLDSPTQQQPQPYLPSITAGIYEDGWNFTAGTLTPITSDLIWNAAYLPDTACSDLPTLIYGPGGAGPPSIAGTAILSDLASHGYTVVALDHPYEQPYLAYPPPSPGYYGLPILNSFTNVSVDDIYQMRLNDTSAFLSAFPSLVAEQLSSPPWNTTHFGIFGHSLGGAAAMGSLLQHPDQLLGAVNMDGKLFGIPETGTTPAELDTGRPIMMLGQELHTPANEASWGPFPDAQSAWWRMVLIQGAKHLDFCDATVWKGLGVSDTPDIGDIDGLRMVAISRAFVRAFFDKVRGAPASLLDGPSAEWPEANFFETSDGKE